MLGVQPIGHLVAEGVNGILTCGSDSVLGILSHSYCFHMSFQYL